MSMSYGRVSVNGIRDVRLLDKFACSQGLRGSENRILNRGIARATTKRIFERKANLIAGWVRISFEQRVGSHNLPWDAESALHRAVFDKGFLQWVEFHFFMHAFSKSLDGNDGLTIRALGRIHAGENRLTIYKNSACATLGFFTSNFC